jgi:acyl-CoA thioester hydrolase
MGVCADFASGLTKTFMLEHHDSTVRVRYAETDQMGLVYHSNYLVWFEIGRVELMRSLGFDYKQMELDSDTYIVVVDAHCRYQHPARYDDLLTVRARILQARSRVLKFGYEILRQSDDRVLATGETTHIACNRAGQVKNFPDKYKTAFLSLAGSADPSSK